MDEKNILEILNDNIFTAQKGRFRKRNTYEKAVEYLNLKYILSIVGVRRCGKSTLMKQLVRLALKQTSKNNILYLNLENPFFNQFKNDVNNLEKIYAIFKKNADMRKKVFVFLDEIQFFTDWQVFIKNLYEKNEAKIVITGSNSRLLSSELTTLLSGRTLPVHIYPFSLKESEISISKYLVNGGFPEVVLKEAKPKTLAELYYKNILYQDVIPRFSVQNSMAMENISYYLISNFGKEISFNSISE